MLGCTPPSLISRHPVLASYDLRFLNLCWSQNTILVWKFTPGWHWGLVHWWRYFRCTLVGGFSVRAWMEMKLESRNWNSIINRNMYFDTYVFQSMALPGWSQRVSFPFNLLARSSLNWPKRMERGHIGAFEFEGDSSSCTASDGLGLYAALLFLNSIFILEEALTPMWPKASWRWWIWLNCCICQWEMPWTLLGWTLWPKHVWRGLWRPVIPKHHLMLHLGKCLRASWGSRNLSVAVSATMETIYTILDHGLTERFWRNFGSIGVVFSALICSLGFHTNASKRRRPRYRSKLLTLYETQCATLSHLCSGSCKCGLWVHVFWSHHSVLISGAYCMAGDVVLFEVPTDGQVNFGKVEMHALQNGKAFTCVSVWPVSGVNELRPDKSQKWYPTRCVNGCLIWHTLPNGVVKIVHQKF